MGFNIGQLVNGEHYLALMLILVLSSIMLQRKIQSEKVNRKGFWLTLSVCALLVVQDILESYAQMDPARRDLRMITTAMGYILRPAVVFGFLLAISPAGRKRWLLWIPLAVNGLVYFVSLFTPIAFYLDLENRFHRGPLNWLMLAVCIGYLGVTLFVLHRRFRDRHAGDLVSIYLCVLGCLGASLADVQFGGIVIIPAILISSMAFYLFLRGQDTDHDPLTGLWNRRVFYEDCRKNRNAVTAVASIDMNGLKKTNDELGHDAGDRALKTIGRGLLGVASKKIFAYRVGGDEFMLLFIHCNKEETEQAMAAFRDEIWRVGLSVAVGVAAKEEDDVPLEELIRISDRRMYENKGEYYQHHDRRRS